MLAELIHTGATQEEVLLSTDVVIRKSCGCNHPAGEVIGPL